MSEFNPEGTEQEIDIDIVGVFEAAGVNLDSIPDDEFLFGQKYHGITVTEVRNAKVSESGRLGVYFKFEMSDKDMYRFVRFGQWIEFPPTEKMQAASGMKFEPETNPEHAKVVRQLKKFMLALGIAEANLNKFNLKDAVGLEFWAKMRTPKLNESGFWDHGFQPHTPVPADEAAKANAKLESGELNQYAPKPAGNSASGGGSATESLEERLLREQAEAQKG